MLICDTYIALIVLDLATGRELVSLPGASNPTFSRSGKRLATQFVQIGNNVKWWDTTNWHELVQFQVPVPGASHTTILAGPGPDDLCVANTKNKDINPPHYPNWMTRFIGVKTSGPPRILNELRVFEIASGKELADFRIEGVIHPAPR